MRGLMKEKNNYLEMDMSVYDADHERTKAEAIAQVWQQFITNSVDFFDWDDFLFSCELELLQLFAVIKSAKKYGKFELSKWAKLIRLRKIIKWFAY